MARVRNCGWLLALALGLVVGLILGGLWPHTPLHATATDRVDNFALATGPVDDTTEAVYYLDFLSGTLRGAVLSNTTQNYQAVYETNIHADLANVIAMHNQNLAPAGRGTQPVQDLQIPANPSYMMVTGAIDIRRVAGQRRRPPRSALYVAEANTGIVLAYVIPWSPEAHSANQPDSGKLILWAGEQFSTAVLRSD